MPSETPEREEFRSVEQFVATFFPKPDVDLSELDTPLDAPVVTGDEDFVTARFARELRAAVAGVPRA